MEIATIIGIVIIYSLIALLTYQNISYIFKFKKLNEIKKIYDQNSNETIKDLEAIKEFFKKYQHQMEKSQANNDINRLLKAYFRRN